MFRLSKKSIKMLAKKKKTSHNLIKKRNFFRFLIQNQAFLLLYEKYFVIPFNCCIFANVCKKEYCSYTL